MNNVSNSTGLNLTNNRRFESVFRQSSTLLSDEIIWFKTKIIIDDISEDYQIIIKKKESVLSQFVEWPHGDRPKQSLLCYV